MALTMVGTGSQARIPADPAQAGGHLPADPAVAGLAPGVTLSPDPATAGTQKAGINMLP